MATIRLKERSDQIEEKSKINAFNQDESKINSKLVDLEKSRPSGLRKTRLDPTPWLTERNGYVPC